ncbi:MAG: glycerol dehydrogenase [Deltaproteobacteria bacterium]|nr:glycerol dehydrogenase [Deltaproteobacteria bacterium]
MSAAVSRAFGAPFRYVQGPGEIRNLPAHAAPHGRKVLAAVDPYLFPRLGPELRDIFAGSGTEIAAVPFGGECTEDEVARLAGLAKSLGSRVVCGLGGGKTLDAAKLAGADLKLPVVIVPTSASTDAPVSAMGVLYRPDGRHLRCRTFDHAPELVVVDSEIVARAPLRLFVAGIGDALSTWPEAEACLASGTPNYVGRGYGQSLAGGAVAAKCHEIVLGKAPAAVADLSRGLLTEAVEDVIEANILLSGLGFENNGCAAAHALHTGIHELEGSGALYHGEVVAFGVLFQGVLERRPPDETAMLLDFLSSLGLPVSFRDMGLKTDDGSLALVAGRIMDGGSGVTAEPFAVTRETVLEALVKADRLGRRWRASRPELPEPYCLRGRGPA